MIERRRLSLEERQRVLTGLKASLDRGDITLGQLVRGLRLDLLGMDQLDFSKVCRVSERTLKNIEADRGNPTLGTLHRILRPFGFEMGVVLARR